MSQTAQFDQANNPYRSAAALELAEDALDVDETELRAFVGPRADYFLRKWAPRLQDPSGDVGMNWAALFLGTFWTAYRKMYRVTFIFIGVMILLAIAQQIVFVSLLGGEAVPPGVGAIVNVMSAIVCGLCGNSWYLTHTKRAISAARAGGFQDDHLLYELSRRGGTSWLAVFAMMGLIFVLTFLLVLGLIMAAVIGQAH